MRTIFVGDIHWCYDEFLWLLDKINYNKNYDKLYLTWDLINKGPKAKELLDLLIDTPEIKSVIWNNEVNFIRYLKFKGVDIEKIGKWIKNYEILKSKGLFDKTYEKQNLLFESYILNFSEKHIRYLLNLPLWIESKDWILLHWGLVPGKNLESQTLDEITRIRDYNWKPWYKFYTWEKVIIYWHWAADGLRIRENTKWLDSGCVYWKRLTAYIWETKEIIQQSALNIYVDID